MSHYYESANAAVTTVVEPLSSSASRLAAVVSTTAMLATLMVAMAFGAERAAIAGPRSIGMGEAYVAVAEGAEAAWSNPAGFAYSDGKEVLFAAAIAGQNTASTDAYAAYSEGWGGKLAGALYFNYDSFRTDGLSLSQGAIAYSVASRLGWCSTGVTIKYELNNEEQADGSQQGRSGSGLGLDFGILGKVGAKTRWGLLLQDAVSQQTKWSDGSSHKYSINVRPGIAYRTDDGILLSAELYNTGALFDSASSDPPKLRLGGEKQMHIPRDSGDIDIAVRVGGAKTLTEAGGTLTAGIGIKADDKHIDYAYRRQLSDGSAVGLHLIGLGMSF